MVCLKVSRKQRLSATIAISFSFFIAELATGFYTGSLALIADAFHYLSDLVGFIVALVAVVISERPEPAPKQLTYGWQRATILGAFFNGVFLLALGVSILVQAIERFTKLNPVEHPKIVLIVGCVGFGLNVLVMSFLHEHDHGHSHGHGHPHNHSHAHDHAQVHNSDETHGPDDCHSNAHTQHHSNQLDSDQTQGPDARHSHTHAPHHSQEMDSDETCTDLEKGKRLEPVSLPPIAVTRQTTSLSAANAAHLAKLQIHTEHKHNQAVPSAPGRDLGMLGVLVHVIGDAINNIGVIVAAVIIWKVDGHAKYYVDPAMGVFIAIMIFLTAIPLTKSSGSILLQVAPTGVDLDSVQHDLEMIPGIESVHELHIWRLDQSKSVASAHVVVDDKTVSHFADKAKTIMECLHAYGVHSATLQPETRRRIAPTTSSDRETSSMLTAASSQRISCQLACGGPCEELQCCKTLDGK
ncbi:hypothetical protein CDD82_3677 [Ophiocordyceps australis]|uniref:Cation efflux protein cytoplasmic domain-containing protein n=1 Tax=Ophiocordyceps australis TaxID=1399860 RepID=A0A2C5Z5F8_9HYPO|nr:hypothetical protein CDD82_3677 [Ophiocordyceps australis]